MSFNLLAAAAYMSVVMDLSSTVINDVLLYLMIASAVASFVTHRLNITLLHEVLMAGSLLVLGYVAYLEHSVVLGVGSALILSTFAWDREDFLFSTPVRHVDVRMVTMIFGLLFTTVGLELLW